MSVSPRFMAFALAVVAVALTLTGVVAAATDTSVTGRASDPLALRGAAPTSATVALNVTTGAATGVSASVAVDFATNQVSALVRIPLVVSTAAIDARLIGSRLYVRSANESSGPWFDTTVAAPSLLAVADVLARPDLGRLRGFTRTDSPSGSSTTYVLTRHGVAVSSLSGSTSRSPQLGTVRWSITVGSGGEFSSSELRVTTARSLTVVDVNVVNYNQPVRVVAPSPSNVRPLAPSVLRGLLNSSVFASVVLPAHLASLGGAASAPTP